MSGTKKLVSQLVIAVCGVFAVLAGLTWFNNSLLGAIFQPWRAILVIVMQWLLFLVPGILMLCNKESIRALGFPKGKILRQILVGVALALPLSAVFTVLPILLGIRVADTTYTQAWQFAYQFVYSIFGVAVAEELVFRGYLFQKLLALKNSRWFAILVSSALFGLFHVFTGNPVQMLLTAVLGLIFCVFREKVKGCTLLSLILVHGIYDALIVLWVAVL